MRARPRTPPTTPPAIAPASEWCVGVEVFEAELLEEELLLLEEDVGWVGAVVLLGVPVDLDCGTAVDSGKPRK